MAVWKRGKFMDKGGRVVVGVGRRARGVRTSWCQVGGAPEGDAISMG